MKKCNCCGIMIPNYETMCGYCFVDKINESNPKDIIDNIIKTE